MASKDVSDTTSLVNAYNTAKSDKEKEAIMDIFNKYIHFIENPPRLLTDNDWKSYLEVGNIKSFSVSQNEVRHMFFSGGFDFFV